MEMWVRFGIFVLIFSGMVVWEFVGPRRQLAHPRQERWPTNLGLTLLDVVLVWGTVGAVAYTAAVFAAEQQTGLLHWMPLPGWLAALLTLLVLDFSIYLQHVIFHALPALWRLHQIHHADLGFDATTGLRFHPIEIFLSLAYKAAVVVLLGAVPWAVVVFEVILNTTSVFNHGNVTIPIWLDRWLRWFIVTPDMHCIHHSLRVVETDSNFGFSVPWWDRLCGTYRAEPAVGQGEMELGLADYRTPIHLGQLLLLPFRGSTNASGWGTVWHSSGCTPQPDWRDHRCHCCFFDCPLCRR
jgi:sterol desaturase/sphingolipid hydroxylase (fatty acid hydroxylase superfamily)